MMLLSSLTPGVIRSYDQNTRLCRVEIPGLTDGAEVFPEAEFCYPIGDKSEHTEIKIIAGDRVWLSFIGGDTRYPIIMGYRPKNTGNANDWRKFHHKNFDIQAIDGVVIINAKTGMTIASQTGTISMSAPNISLNGALAINGSGVTHNGVNIGASHVHGGVMNGMGSTNTPS